MAVIVATRQGDTLNGTALDDSITGSAGAGDLIFGDLGSDTLNGGGGPGGDNLRFPDTLFGGGGNDRIELTLLGSAFGEDGDDTLVAPQDFGTYLLEGGAGDDRLEGNFRENRSSAAYTRADSGVNVSLRIEGPQAVGGGHGVDTLIGIDGLVGSPHGDTLIAPVSGSGFIVGGDGNDRLVGGDGLGNQIDAGAGDDTVLGGANADTVLFGRIGFGTQPAGGLTVDLRISEAQAIGGGMGHKTLVGIEGVAGGDFGDTLTGTTERNFLTGLAGDDSLAGLEGDDSFDGGDGHDTLVGGGGNDGFQTRGGNDVVMGGDGDDQAFAGISSDVPQDQFLHGNRGNDTLMATRGADSVRGGQGDDVLRGAEGNDFLAGDRGDDTLTGGTGADIFHAWAEAGLDQVTDFSAAQGDRVYLLPGASPTISQVGADTVIDFGGGNRMVLVGVPLSSLPDGWIFGA